VLKLLKKRLFSSPAAFASTLARHEQTLAEGRGQSKRPQRPTLGILRRQIARIDEDYADDDEYEDAASGAVGTSTRLFHAPSPRERWLLDHMRAWASKATAQRDCKTRALIKWLRGVVRPGGKWSQQRVLIFTEYRATQNWLHEILAAEKLAGGQRLLTLYGGMDSDERERIKAAFQASPDVSPVRILLATDAASEGIDLQNHCHRLVHLEIPWNPNRMEQRNGRIDRHGQTKDPLIYHFASKSYQQARSTDLPRHRPPGQVSSSSELEADLEFLLRAARKVEQIREDLGKVGPVIARQVQQAMLGQRARLDTSMAEAEAGTVRKMLKFERDLQEQVRRHYEQLRQTRHDLRLEPDNVRAVVETALKLAGQPDLTGLEKPASSYHLPPLSGSWAAASEGLAHPHTGDIRPLVFDQALVRSRDDVVLAHLNHRLVQMALRLLRAEVWSPQERQGLKRVTARRVPDHALESPAVVAHARLLVIGGDSHRLHEEIITAGGLIRQGRFRRLNVGQTQAALDAALDEPVSEATGERLSALWDALRPALERALEARVRDRTAGVTRLLEQRAVKEARDIESVLQELAQTIEAELDEPEAVQLELFSSPELDQLQRNVQALRARLA
ncbi:MAG: helicase, partial [Delftia sp.]|nr:helicase [Delftia sp.]